MKPLFKKNLSILLIACFLSSEISLSAENISVIGTGYVGLILGLGLSELGYPVVCADTDRQKIESLSQGISPFYEPNTEALLKKHLDSHSLTFMHNVTEAIEASDIIFIAVGTPAYPDGSANLEYVTDVFEIIFNVCLKQDTRKIVCLKSTIPIGTTDEFHKKISELHLQDKIALVYNPEFLRQASALHDFFNPARTVLGGYDNTVLEKIAQLFGNITTNAPVIYTTPVTAETIKYTSNAFLATKLSFINDIDLLCNHTKADINTVIYGLGLDKRIGSEYLQPGPGFGGSCLPKDCQALIRTAQKFNLRLDVVEAALTVNQKRKDDLLHRIKNKLNNDFDNKTVCILGLSFKENTDDMRESPAVYIMQSLIELGIKIQAFDPIVKIKRNKSFSDVSFYTTIEDAQKNAVITIGFNEFKKYSTL